MFLSVEHLIVNRWPGKWSSVTNLLSFEIDASSGVPLAILRGVALGAAAIGVYSFARFIGMHNRLSPWLPSSDAIGYLNARIPAGLALIILSGVGAFAAVVCLAFCISLIRRYSHNSLILVGVGALIWLATRAYVVWNTDTIPWLWFEWIVVALFASIVALAFVHYDFLTQFVCLFSCYLTLNTYALWGLFRDVGNFQFTAVFLLAAPSFFSASFWHSAKDLL
jgi:hypothetical protein